MRDWGRTRIIFDKGNTLTTDIDHKSKKAPEFINEGVFKSFKRALDSFGEENVIILENVPKKILEEETPEFK